MFKLGRRISNLAKPFLNFHRNFQVSVIGASQPLGQSISLLLKGHPLVHRLTIFGAPGVTNGVAMDLSHIPRVAMVEGWTGRMEFALKGSDIVVVACGDPKQAGQTDHDHFKRNADSFIQAMQEIVVHCPKAFVIVATNPINHTVPLAVKVLESGSCYDKAKILGVSSLDTMRAQTYVCGVYRILPHFVKVPVICGHSSKTIVPLFSHIMPRFKIADRAASALTDSIRDVDNRVADLKGASTLSSAYATFCTVSAVLNAMNGFAVEHTAFVANNDYGTKFFATPIIITAYGISAVMRYKNVTALESDYINESTKQLTKDVREGESYFNRDKHYPKAAKVSDILNYIKTL